MEREKPGPQSWVVYGLLWFSHVFPTWLVVIVAGPSNIQQFLSVTIPFDLPNRAIFSVRMCEILAPSWAGTTGQPYGQLMSNLVGKWWCASGWNSDFCSYEARGREIPTKAVPKSAQKNTSLVIQGVCTLGISFVRLVLTCLNSDLTSRRHWNDARLVVVSLSPGGLFLRSA